MSNTGGDYDNVASAQFEQLAAFAAKPDSHGSRGNAENLMRCAVIMVMRVDPIDPSSTPMIAGE
jgi:hypothetical protein